MSDLNDDVNEIQQIYLIDLKSKRLVYLLLFRISKELNTESAVNLTNWSNPWLFVYTFSWPKTDGMNYTIKQSKYNDVINDDNLAKDRPPRDDVMHVVESFYIPKSWTVILSNKTKITAGTTTILR
ncbi:uncharacterized protein OCT59_026687 [Rhizophagus irregularis]|uniref:uncharacterized protein n=1 Tax=Rhizophagus irregularis TaxID=588596 RepID=UPI0019DB752B|nr:hypothetical protein OCT59_026687 [Rhizophagus irregularis]GET50066.1 hypothetical protein RIR_jg32368.t1 [Rhizophagus irregularis DAOM 181602=DAOM 197198]